VVLKSYGGRRGATLGLGVLLPIGLGVVLGSLPYLPETKSLSDGWELEPFPKVVLAPILPIGFRNALLREVLREGGHVQLPLVPFRGKGCLGIETEPSSQCVPHCDPDALQPEP